MIGEAKAKAVLDRVLGAAKGIELSAWLRAEQSGNTRFARNEITSSGDAERFTVGVTAQIGQRSATASGNQLDERSLDDVVARAVRMAKLAPENPEAMPVLGKQTYVKASGADATTAALTPAARAKAAGAAIAAADAAKIQIAGFFVHDHAFVARATSAGLWAAHEATSVAFSCTGRTADGTGSGWAGQSSHRAADVDAHALALTAVDKAVKSQNPRRLDPGRYTVILEPAAVASLLAFLLGQLGARRADEGRSFFAKHKVGDALFPDTITLHSDPRDAATHGAPFDGEGFPLQPTKWIDKGKLAALTYTRYWAKKQGKQPTGSPSGWTLDGGSVAREAMIKGVDRGVLITRFWYLRDLDPQTILATGLTRDGTFLIEKGEIRGPVNNFRFNESPVQMLARCDALGAQQIPGGGEGGGFRVPLLRTHEFNLASISEAI